MCQATSTYPRRKYESNGGPSARGIIDLLDQWCRDDGVSIRRFIDALIVNILLGAPDAHAKNYSVLHVAGRRLLAPLYDIASGLPYTTGSRSFGSPGGAAPWRTSAMSVGGKRELSRIGGEQWARLAKEGRLRQRAGMDEAALFARIRDLADLIPDTLSQTVTAQRRDNPAAADKELPERLLDAVAARCSEAVALFG